jgi:hypothetical protein
VRTPRFPLWIALLAVVASVIGAVGPADHLRTAVSWPPRNVPAAAPSRLWYTPLLLIRQKPEVISARVPCSLPEPLGAATLPVTVLATARSPERSGGLEIVRDDNALAVKVGARVLARLDLPKSQAGLGECRYALRLGQGTWSVQGGPEDTASQGGSLEAMPFTSGIFSALDLRSGSSPSIELITSVHAGRPTTRQAIAWILAVLAAISALVLTAVSRGSGRTWGAPRAALRVGAAHAQWVDAVVAVLLVAWWFLSPAVWDEGWIAATLRNFSASGDFSTYYNAFGANHPFSYWLEWMLHWPARASTASVVLRIPALLCLGATWVLCRWILARTLTSVGRDATAVWAMAGMFLLGGLGWGMTLRPEPEVALLGAGVLACTVRFLDRRMTAPLALATVLIVLAIAAHPGGVVTIAPLLAAAPQILGWARVRLSGAATIISADLALLIVLVFVGSDVDLRLSDARTIGVYGGVAADWRDEAQRYDLLFGAGHEIPLRHGFVALMFAAVLAYVLRKRSAGQAALDLASISLALGLLLLVATPTKLPYHFGGLVGVAAVAVAGETARLRVRSRSTAGWAVVPFLAVAVTVVAIAWSWEPRSAWNALDLRSLSWQLGFESRSPLSAGASLVPLTALLAALALVRVARGRMQPLHRVPWLVGSWSTVLLAAPLIAFTVGVLTVDALKTDAWTFTRQNLQSLRGAQKCGLGNAALVPDIASMRPAAVEGAEGNGSLPGRVPAAPVPGLARYVLVPSDDGGASSPWIDLPRSLHIGLFVAREPETPGELELEWGRRGRTRVESLGRDEVAADLGNEERSDFAVWSFLTTEELPRRRAGSNAVRLVFRSDVVPGSARVVTAPVTYRNELLARRLEFPGSRSVVLPNLVLYLPCARLSRLDDGIVEVPDQIVAVRTSWPIGLSSSPFEGITDVYRLERLPLTDTSGLLAESILYNVDRRMPGARLLRPAEIVTS